MITKAIEVVLSFYRFSANSYSFYKFAGSKTISALKPYQTGQEQIHKLVHEIEHFIRNLARFSLAFLKHHTTRLTINLV
jgi:VanZ family protein